MSEQKNVFVQREEEVLDFWDKNKIFEKSVDKEAPQGEYVFYDGPPFATGTPHYGHLVGNLMKDVVPRFWTMKGYRVRRKWGWDCHGLPIENIVEKELGSKNKQDMEKIGVEKFNQKCREKVFLYANEWEKVVHRLGRWADMENSYKTMDLDFMESVWWVFKQLWDKDLIYKDYRSMHVCPRCETTLSQTEVSEGYKNIKDLSVVAKFALISEENTYVLAWTTTPWTLIGNVALAVGGDIEYAKVKMEDNYYILAKEKIETWLEGKEYEVIETFTGEKLKGLEYKPPFNYYYQDSELENRENGWKIYLADFVNTEEGTGVVHIAPAFGEDDMNLGKENSLPFVQHITFNGEFKEEVENFKGQLVKPIEDPMQTDIEIIKYLAHNDLLFAKQKYEHSYPHCWRCDTPLLNYATSSWFVAINKIKPQILDLAQEINWSPEHIKKGRFGKWLEGARDWSVSRQRFWASVMPVWECKECGEREVFGSVKELEEKSGEKVNDLHKDVVDKITFSCSKCSGQMERIEDVLDTWFDSGSMPYAQMHYPFENKDRFENNFPAEFIAEGVDQTRCWFYYLHAISTAIMEKPAYKNVIVNGIVLAEDGKKMSKKLQNYPDPLYILENYGSDPLRYYLLSSSVTLAENFSFSEKGVAEAMRKTSMLLWNVFKFYSLYEKEIKDIETSENILDTWIKARLQETISTMEKAMEEYYLPRALKPIGEFIDDLSTWYIRRSRDRFKSDNKQDKQASLQTTHEVLLTFSKALAPFLPFISEQLWQKLTGNNFEDEEKSVHLENWPEINLQEKDKEVIDKMLEVRKIVELALAKREEAGFKVRQPLNKVVVYNSNLEEKYFNLILEEINIKSLEKAENSNKEIEIELDTVLTDELKKEGIKRELIRQINNLRKNMSLTIEDRVALYYQTFDETIKQAFQDFSQDIKQETLSTDIIEKEDLEEEKEIKINESSLKLKLEK